MKLPLKVFHLRGYSAPVRKTLSLIKRRRILYCTNNKVAIDHGARSKAYNFLIGKRCAREVFVGLTALERRNLYIDIV